MSTQPSEAQRKEASYQEELESHSEPHSCWVVVRWGLKSPKTPMFHSRLQPLGPLDVLSGKDATRRERGRKQGGTWRWNGLRVKEENSVLPTLEVMPLLIAVLVLTQVHSSPRIESNDGTEVPRIVSSQCQCPIGKGASIPNGIAGGNMMKTST